MDADKDGERGGALNDQPFNDTRPAIDLPNTCENWVESVPTWTMLSQHSRRGSSQTMLDDVAGQSKDTGTSDEGCRNVRCEWPLRMSCNLSSYSRLAVKLPQLLVRLRRRAAAS